jgi:hypothetical protein
MLVGRGQVGRSCTHTARGAAVGTDLRGCTGLAAGGLASALGSRAQRQALEQLCLLNMGLDASQTTALRQLLGPDVKLEL